jgi:hypothetical protein
MDLLTLQNLDRRIHLIRGHRVMLDADLAVLYGVETWNISRAVIRNVERFPPDFMSQLNREEYASLRRQIGVLEKGRHAKYLPRVFTEEGVAMLSGVLRSRRAVEANVAIMRAFVKLRAMVSAHKDLSLRLDELERKYNKRFKLVFEAIRELMEPRLKSFKPVGFHPRERTEPRF